MPHKSIDPVTFITRCTPESEALSRLSSHETYGLSPEILLEILRRDKRKKVQRAIRKILWPQDQKPKI